MNRNLFSQLKLMMLAPALLPVAATGQEVRGTWLTTTGPDHITSGLNTDSIFSTLQAARINTAYVESWKNGFTQYPSPTFQSVTGIDRNPNLGTRDILDESSIAAHRRGMIHIAWFEYGFSPQFIGNGGTPSNAMAVYAQNQGWLLEDQSGNYANASNGFAWMNPAVPEVRQFLIDITLDAVRTHDLDGIQFDDRLAWPREFGWDATTATLYQQETGRSLPSSIFDSNFREWRQDKVTLFAQELSTALRAEFPDLHLSVSPSITNFSDNNFNAEWPEWVSQGLFDEYVVQAYRDNFSSFASILPGQISAMGPNEEQLVVGLRINGTGADTPQQDLLDMVNLSQTSANGNLAGQSFFYSLGVTTNQAALANEYGSDADNPFFAADWRPDPVAGSYRGGFNWELTVTEPGDYRLVVEDGGRWRTVEVLDLPAGTFIINLPGVGASEHAELLVSRSLEGTDIVLGDLNLDGMVDGNDFGVFASNFGITSGAVFTDGDFNGDGMVDGNDFGVIASNFGFGTTLSGADLDALVDATGVPEPASLLVLASGALWATRRRRTA